MEASHKTHRPHIKVGKDAEEEHVITQTAAPLNVSNLIS